MVTERFIYCRIQYPCNEWLPGLALRFFGTCPKNGQMVHSMKMYLPADLNVLEIPEILGKKFTCPHQNVICQGQVGKP
jgi:hypothetical protein